MASSTSSTSSGGHTLMWIGEYYTGHPVERSIRLAVFKDRRDKSSGLIEPVLSPFQNAGMTCRWLISTH